MTTDESIDGYEVSAVYWQFSVVAPFYHWRWRVNRKGSPFTVQTGTSRSREQANEDANRAIKRVVRKNVDRRRNDDERRRTWEIETWEIREGWKWNAVQPYLPGYDELRGGPRKTREEAEADARDQVGWVMRTQESNRATTYVWDESEAG